MPPLSVAEFVEYCLFNPESGYYMKDAERAGKRGDFYTSSTLSPKVFSEMLIEAAQTLAAKNRADLPEFKVAEIGAEPNKGLFENAQTFGVKDELKLEGSLFLFSNELLDSRPFDRFVFRRGKVFKTYLDFSKNPPRPEIFELPAEKFEAEALKKYFPEAPENFAVDFSFDSLNLLKKIADMPWRGTLIFLDYYRSAAELMDMRSPSGRAYKSHFASSDIFSMPANCDITFSPPIEPYLDILHESGFSEIGFAPQGAFFVKSAPNKIREILESRDALSPEKRALGELLSPAHMGECFRVLSASR